MKKRIKFWLENTSEVLKELLAGIFLYSILVTIIGIFFVKDQGLFVRGLWVGAVTAMGMAIHMERTAEYVLELDSDGAKRYWQARSVLRMLIAMGVLAIVVYFKIGSVLPCFIGVMGLKVAAYMQPITHKWLSSRR